MNAKQYTYSECISKANEFMQKAFEYEDKSIAKNSSIYANVAFRHAQTAAKWFELARLAKFYGWIAAMEKPFNAPIYIAP